YFTLHHLAHLIAPLCPFLAEEIYRQLDGRLPSVHLADWPELSLDDDRLLSRMRRTRRCIAAGLALRAEAGVKVRQPLSRLTVSGDEQLSKLDGDFLDLMTDELNVKEVVFRRDATFSAELDTELSRELRHEGWVRELVRRVQVLRKTAGLEVENRIHLSLQTGDDELLAAFEAFADYVRGETLTVNYDLGAKAPSLEVSCELELNGHLIAISLQKA
ncbi:class I tRNA ligase family protein, partial [Candidatus Saccharibacteria bacterium]|nr:class I tRNA ligase family protein [Candidatus Saccharibacteria bacterium]